MKIRTALAACLLTPICALAQVAPNLNTTAPFAVLGLNGIPTSGTVTCTDTGAPPSSIIGQVGTTFNGGITNTLCGITGPIVSPVAAGVVNDFNTAFTAIDTLNPDPACTGVIPIVTTTLTPGVYCSVAGTTIGAGVILTLQGTASDVFIFRVGTGGLGALTLNSAQIIPGGSTNPCNVYVKTASGAAFTTSIFNGNLLSGAAITMTGGSFTGRAFARTDITLTDPTPLTGCSALAAGPGSGTGIPTLSEWAMFLLASLLAMAGFAAMRRQAR